MQTDSVYKSVDVDLTHRASRFGCEADFKIQNKFFQLEKNYDRLIETIVSQYYRATDTNSFSRYFRGYNKEMGPN